MFLLTSIKTRSTAVAVDRESVIQRYKGKRYIALLGKAGKALIQRYKRKRYVALQGEALYSVRTQSVARKRLCSVIRLFVYMQLHVSVTEIIGKIVIQFYV